MSSLELVFRSQEEIKEIKSMTEDLGQIIYDNNGEMIGSRSVAFLPDNEALQLFYENVPQGQLTGPAAAGVAMIAATAAVAAATVQAVATLAAARANVLNTCTPLNGVDRINISGLSVHDLISVRNQIM